MQVKIQNTGIFGGFLLPTVLFLAEGSLEPLDLLLEQEDPIQGIL